MGLQSLAGSANEARVTLTGGESRLADCFDVIHSLNGRFPASFETLTKTDLVCWLEDRGGLSMAVRRDEERPSGCNSGERMQREVSM